MRHAQAAVVAQRVGSISLESGVLKPA